MILKNLTKILCCCIIVCTTTACGGGSGASSPDTSVVSQPTNTPPSVQAGSDAQYIEGEQVMLEGSASDSDGSIASMKWEQITDFDINLSNTDAASTQFVVPATERIEIATFRLTVTDDDGDSNNDTVDITFIPKDDDNDGLSNKFEVNRGTDPTLGDSDLDGISDAFDKDPLDSQITTLIKYIKINEAGNIVSSDSTVWSCVLVNAGMSHASLWEVKSNDNNSIRYKNALFTWYQPNATYRGEANEGDDGAENESSCPGYTSNQSSTFCNTNSFVKHFNEEAYCGSESWKLPNRYDYSPLFESNTPPYINSEFFPTIDSINQPSFWRSETYQPNEGKQGALVADLHEDNPLNFYALTSQRKRIRLVTDDVEIDLDITLSDTDNDGVDDYLDSFPKNSKETIDTDSDGIGNNSDKDDDNDGFPDNEDAFPLNSGEWLDTDNDSIGNNTDDDDDGDGIKDNEDSFPLDVSEWIDTDSDGVGNNADTDDDNDGIVDIDDYFPASSSWPKPSYLLLNRLVNAKIEVFSFPELELIAETRSTGSEEGFENSGAFYIPMRDFSEEMLESPYLLLKVSEGVDLDPDGDGISDDNHIKNAGNFYAIIPTTLATRGLMNISVLQDIVYHKFKDSLPLIANEPYSAFSPFIANFLADTDGSGEVNLNDYMGFIPHEDKKFFLFPWQNVIDLYHRDISNNKLSQRKDRIESIEKLGNISTDSPSISRNESGDVSNIIQLNKSDYISKISTSKYDSSNVTVTTETFLEDDINFRMHFVADNPDTFFLQPDDFIKSANIDFSKKEDVIRVTIPKEIMNSWSNSAPYIQTDKGDVDVTVIDDDPVLDFIFRPGDSLRLINNELRTKDEEAIELSADSFNSFTTDPIDIRYQLQFTLRDVSENLRIYGNTKIFEDDTFLYYVGQDDPIEQYQIDFETSGLAGINKDVRIKIGLSETNNIQWYAVENDTKELIAGNVDVENLGYFTGQFTDFYNGFLSQDAEIGVSAGLFRLAIGEPIPSIRDEADEVVSEIKVLKYDEAQLTITNHTSGPWHIGETITVEFEESGIPDSTELALFYVAPQTFCGGATNCLAEMKNITANERQQGLFELQLSTLSLNRGEVSFDDEVPSKFCIKPNDFSGGYQYCNDISVYVVEDTSYSLTISKTGQGTITSSPTGINCGNDCSESYASGTVVKLTASEASGYTSVNWGGSCSGTSNSCTVTMSQARSVSASFTQISNNYELSVSKSGQGTITSSPTGINCGNDCSESYASGTVVKLTASEASGYNFSGWGGSCSGTSKSCTVTMSQARSVSASFTQISNNYELSVSKSGQGTITSSPTGINCGNDCSESYAPGTVVKLTASEASGYNFSGWGGSCSGTSKSCTVTMSQARSVSAVFSENESGNRNWPNYLAGNWRTEFVSSVNPSVRYVDGLSYAFSSVKDGTFLSSRTGYDSNGTVLEDGQCSGSFEVLPERTTNELLRFDVDVSSVTCTGDGSFAISQQIHYINENQIGYGSKSSIFTRQ